MISATAMQRMLVSELIGSPAVSLVAAVIVSTADCQVISVATAMSLTTAEVAKTILLVARASVVADTLRLLAAGPSAAFPLASLAVAAIASIADDQVTSAVTALSLRIAEAAPTAAEVGTLA